MDNFNDIIDIYLKIFPEEKERQEKILEFLNDEKIEDKIDWNNFDGHLVVGAFIYSKRSQKFLCLYHKDLNMYLYPGGHIDKEDNNILDAVLREIKEETGISNLNQITIAENKFIPIDIDTHMIDENKRLNLPSHYHFEFRYLFSVDEEFEKITIDEKEIRDFKWISIEELSLDNNYGKLIEKIKKHLKCLKILI